MKRICVVITARPSYSRIKTALVALREAGADLQIIAAASALTWRHGRVADVIRADGFDIAAELPAVIEGERCEAAMSTGLLTMQMAPILAGLKPDCVVTIADRHETLATAIAASYQHIPLCHVQGGEISGSIDDKVRNAVTQLADLHLVATGLAKVGVEAMRYNAIAYVTGCPSIDLAAEAVRLGPIHRADVIVLQHPVTGEVEQAGEQMRQTIEAVGNATLQRDGLIYEKEALYFWPGEDAGADAMSKELRLAGIHPVRNLEPVEFLRVLLGARVLVGNSSVGIRECSFLGVPVVNVGTRQQGRERGPNAWDVTHVECLIRDAIKAQRNRTRDCYPSSTLYGDGHAGERIAKALMEWTT